MAQTQIPEGRRNPKLEERHINGYFAHIGTSRSGHNFIKKNIFSYLNDPNGETRKYLNLENLYPSRFDVLYENVKFEDHPNSVYILTVRSLMNWYSSMMHFLTKNRAINGENLLYKPGPKILNALRELENKQLVNQSTVDKNPEMLADPNVVIIPDDFVFEKPTPDGEIITSMDEFLNDTVNKTIDRWLAIAKEFKGVTNYVPGFVKVYYDQFFVDQEYRKNICSQVNGSYNENEIEVVSKAGGGSSFDLTTFDGHASDMKVLERYKQWKIKGLEEPNPFLKYIKTHEALDFYLNNFDVPEEEKKFIDNI